MDLPRVALKRYGDHQRCPTCSHQYIETWCPGCNRMSLHEAWYEKPEDD